MQEDKIVSITQLKGNLRTIIDSRNISGAYIDSILYKNSDKEPYVKVSHNGKLYFEDFGKNESGIYELESKITTYNDYDGCDDTGCPIILTFVRNETFIRKIGELKNDN